MKVKYSWFPIGNLLLIQVSIYINTETSITKLDVISISVSTYTSIGLIIQSSFINNGQSFQSHPNTHAQSRYIAVRSVRF